MNIGNVDLPCGMALGEEDMLALVVSISVMLLTLNIVMGLPVLISTVIYLRGIYPLAGWLPLQLEVLDATEECAIWWRIIAVTFATIVFLPLTILWLIIAPIFHVVSKGRQKHRVN